MMLIARVRSSFFLISHFLSVCPSSPPLPSIFSPLSSSPLSLSPQLASSLHHFISATVMLTTSRKWGIPISKVQSLTLGCICTLLSPPKLSAFLPLPFPHLFLSSPFGTHISTSPHTISLTSPCLCISPFIPFLFPTSYHSPIPLYSFVSLCLPRLPLPIWPSFHSLSHSHTFPHSLSPLHSVFPSFPCFNTF